MAKKSTGKPKTPEKDRDKAREDRKSKGRIAAAITFSATLVSVVVSVTVVGLNLTKIIENVQDAFRSRERLEITLKDDLPPAVLNAYIDFGIALPGRDTISLLQFEVTNDGASRDTVIVGVEIPCEEKIRGFGIVNSYRGVRRDTLPYLEERREETYRATTRILEFPNGGKIRAAVWVTKECSERDSVICRIWTEPAAWGGVYVCTLNVSRDTSRNEEEQ